MAENQSFSSGYRSVHGNEESLGSSLYAQDDHQQRPQSAQEYLLRVTDLCCRCGHLEHRTEATHICLTCSAYGRYYCGMCLREHNFFCNNQNHDVRSLSRLTEVHTNAKKISVDIIKSTDNIWKQLSKDDIETATKAMDVDSLLDEAGIALKKCEDELRQLSVTLNQSIQIADDVPDQSAKSQKKQQTENIKHQTLLQQSKHIRDMLKTWKNDRIKVQESIRDLEGKVTMISNNLTAESYDCSQSPMRVKSVQHPNIFKPLFQAITKLSASVDESKRGVAENRKKMLDKEQEKLIEDLQVEDEILAER